MILDLSILGLALAALFALMVMANLIALQPPPRPGGRLPGVSILIPARDEAGNIGAALDAALGQQGVEAEVIVLDDGSTDGTDRVVAERAADDPRLRLIRGADLPAGWIGKTHACAQLGRAATRPVLLFVDADVRLTPDAAARLLAAMEAGWLDLVSGFPRQITGTFWEKVAIPQIFTTLLGYLPIPMSRLRPEPAFGAGCGQLLAVRRAAYDAAGGHAAFAGQMHDGILLPRNVRASGGRTDLIDATAIAATRMYDSLPKIWSGFLKNAAEGMATPRALPIWTLLLFGGHVLPWLTLAAALGAGSAGAAQLSALAIALVTAARAAMALRLRGTALGVALHPVGILLLLAIQYTALWRSLRGRPATWRGRSYLAGGGD
ncbi:glycosyltransferase family 2 protein [Wenxinia saemankumensis]|uniref:Glycosyltransferase, catalytic subunit of cellulose synthase and poly-beta-1,6-N-acetylglucosamine synthase n=1 Tax=Wenxinia saemankumensis TaxID=1447782 RepID=A0A1M6D1K0_9RHOB|nr:glycosyltransferase family 2 protein [Wenxinia saemankumensis]SHI66981.1 Glycosyltransferase, catalytic subunit of cellulose synthase and poly-beta-1,6-N-acetylglucosamine synthase [Wenxinia saemankumensis]